MGDKGVKGDTLDIERESGRMDKSLNSRITLPGDKARVSPSCDVNKLTYNLEPQVAYL
jgi:hypothetical protein